ncbi:MAG: UDP-N-acetylmuramate dehydrogenase [Bacteroidota bacterium]
MIQSNVSLQPYNTFGIDVSATAFARFSSVSELETVLLENNGNLPLFILGGGSNVLFTKPVNALVLKNELKGFEHVNETDDTIDIRVGAGEEWHTFVRYCVEKGWGGVENLSLIPGSVGASPMQNIGAYGAEIKDCFVELTAFQIEKRELHMFSAADCAFGYRESVFKRDLKGQYIIVSVTYRLQKHPQFNTAYGAIQTELEAMNVTELSVSAISQAVMNIRNSKLPNPKELGNAGSFFKNPVVDPAVVTALKERFPEVPNYPQPDGSVKLAAGWLIEQAGWKGKRVGNCGVHARQALVLVNYGGATGDEIYALSQAVLDDVQQQFGVLLEREVNIL